KGAKSLSSWRGGPWDTPKTQQTTGQGYHRGTRFQASRAGNLLTALTVVGPVVAGRVALRGRKSSLYAPSDGRNWPVPQFSPMPGIYPSAAFLAPEVSSSASPTTPGA